jgi:hypothetical protein
MRFCNSVLSAILLAGSVQAPAIAQQASAQMPSSLTPSSAAAQAQQAYPASPDQQMAINHTQEQPLEEAVQEPSQQPGGKPEVKPEGKQGQKLTAASQRHHDLCHVNPGGILPPDHVAKCDVVEVAHHHRRTIPSIIGTVVSVSMVGDGYVQKHVCAGRAPADWETEGRVGEGDRLDFNGFSRGYRIDRGYAYGAYYGPAYDETLEPNEAPPQDCWTDVMPSTILLWDVTIRTDSGEIYIKRANFAPSVGDRVRATGAKHV